MNDASQLRGIGGDRTRHEPTLPLLKLVAALALRIELRNHHHLYDNNSIIFTMLTSGCPLFGLRFNPEYDLVRELRS